MRRRRGSKPGSPPKGPLVLIVDDDADGRALSARCLTRAGFGVIEACDGIEALALAVSQRPDAILLDMTMPGLSGWEVAERLRADAATKDVPLIAFTGSDVAIDRGRALSSGCVAFLEKPAEAKTIVRIVETALADARSRNRS